LTVRRCCAEKIDFLDLILADNPEKAKATAVHIKLNRSSASYSRERSSIHGTLNRIEMILDSKPGRARLRDISESRDLPKKQMIDPFGRIVVIRKIS
jgi:hypothetical protein